MEEKECKKILELLTTLRHVTEVVKAAPFVLTTLLFFATISFLFCKEETMSLIDSIIYTSPIWVVLLMIISFILKTCVWHKIACLLPISIELPSFLDAKFSLSGEIAYLCYVIIMAILLIYCGLRTYGRKKHSDRNP